MTDRRNQNNLYVRPTSVDSCSTRFVATTSAGAAVVPSHESPSTREPKPEPALIKPQPCVAEAEVESPAPQPSDEKSKPQLSARPMSPVPHDYDPLRTGDLESPKARPCSQAMVKRRESAAEPLIARSGSPAFSSRAADTVASPKVRHGPGEEKAEVADDITQAAAARTAGTIHKVNVALIILNLLMAAAVIGLNIYGYTKVRSVHGEAKQIHSRAQATTAGMAALEVSSGRSLETIRAGLAPQFSQVNVTCTEKMERVVAACADIKVWMQAIVATLTDIYNKLANQDSTSGAIKDDSTEIMSQLGTLKTSMDTYFPDSTTALALLQSSTTGLATDITKMGTVNTQLTSLSTTITPLIAETVVNSQYIDSFLGGSNLLSSTASVTFGRKTRKLLIVSITGTYYLLNYIDTTVITGTIDTVAYASDWIYSLPYYDVLLFDLCDSYSTNAKFSTDVQNAVLAFIQRGGSVLATHDVIDYTVEWVAGIYPYFGTALLTHDLVMKTTEYKNTANACHQIFQKPNDFSTMTSITTTTVHATYNYATTGKLLMYDDSGYPYLIVKETISGSRVTRCAYTAAGHTSTLTADEGKLIANVIYWLNYQR